MNPRGKKSLPKKFGESMTIPGQALKPSELLKRHLAGTLPDIDLSKKYEYHFDEEGKQVAEPLPIELHEVHKLSVALRQRQYEEALEQRKKQAEKHKEEIIAEYLKANPNIKEKQTDEIKTVEPGQPGEGKPAQKSTPKGRDR